MDYQVHSYPEVYQLGHRAIQDIFKSKVVIEEKIDGCVSLDTPILTSDLRYIPAGFLKNGDELIGFDDTLNDPRLKKSIVISAEPIKKKCLDIETSEGPITTSEDHPFLVRQTTNNNGKIWVNAKDLIPGMSIVSIGRWREESSWEAGYLAGQFDGEGSLVKSGNGRILSYYQKTGPELVLVEKLIKERGFDYSLDIRQRKIEWSRVGSIIFRKNWTDILKFLGTIRPQRLISDSGKIWENSAMNMLRSATVISVKISRTHLVMGLSTSTKTYIAAGFLSHNSQFSFGISENREIFCRSKNKQMIPAAAEKMFELAVETVVNLSPYLHFDWVYRGEFLAKPKHNTLSYSRVPKQNIIIYDIDAGLEAYLDPEEKAAEAHRLGLEVVPCLFIGVVTDFEMFKAFLENESILGGTKIEGVVVKNYSLFTMEKKVAMGKYVSEAFKETNQKNWHEQNPNSKDLETLLIEEYKTTARWDKAVQHLRDAGVLTGTPQDIPLLMKEVPVDVLKECEIEIKEKLFKHYWPKISRGITRGLPEWWKEELAKKSF